MKAAQIIFDFDGTLVSSYETVLKMLQIVASEYFKKEIPLATVKKNYAPLMDDVIKNFGVDHLDPAIYNHFAKRWMELSREMESGYQLFEGIRELLSVLKEWGHTLYIWTARDRRSTLYLLDELKISAFFKDIYCVDDGHPKPDPAGIIEMIGEYRPDNVIVIGDNSIDIEGAKRFGCKSIGALWCFGANEALLKAAKADYLANEPKECISIIKNLFDWRV